MGLDRGGIVDVLIRNARAVHTKDWPLLRRTTRAILSPSLSGDGHGAKEAEAASPSNR
jgi:hypothetical protein